ncbi:hypothetical protein HZS_4651, partial [Henneguya salminicola]
EAVFLLSEAYKELNTAIFINSWEKIFIDSKYSKEIQEQPIREENIKKISENLHLFSYTKNINEDDTKEWICCDNTLENEFLTENEIISLFTEKENSVVDSNEEELINSPEVEKITHQNAKKCFETLITYMEQQEETT